MSNTPETDHIENNLGDAAHPILLSFCRRLERERDSWREAAYSLGEAIPPSWEELQPPAEQLRKFKEMVTIQNKKTERLLDNADEHSKMYP